MAECTQATPSPTERVDEMIEWLRRNAETINRLPFGSVRIDWGGAVVTCNLTSTERLQLAKAERT